MADIYRVIYRAQFCDNKNLESTIDFKKRMSDTLPVPEIKMLTLSGIKTVPVKLSYKEEGDIKECSIKGTELNLKIKAGEDFDLKSLYVTDETEISVTVYGAYNWKGFVLPDNCNEPFLAGSYDVQIKATDRLGILKDVPYIDIDKPIKGLKNDVETLTRALAPTGIDMGFLIAVNTYEQSMNKGSGDDPLSQTYTDQSAFMDSDGGAISCFDVIKSILTRWYAEMYQHNGVWQIVSIAEKQNGNIQARYIPEYNGQLTTIVGTELNAGGENRSIRPVGSSYLAPAIKSALAYYRYGYPSNKLINGDFQDWPVVQNIPNGWKIEQAGTTGNISVSRGVSNADPTDFYAKISGTGSGWFMNSAPIQIRSGEIVGISFDMFAPTGYSPSGGNRYLSIVLRNERGQYFTQNGWRDSFQFYDVVYHSQDLRNQQNVKLDISDLGSDYKLEIGFLLVRTSGGAEGIRYETNINNVNVRPSAVSNSVKPALGSYTENISVSNQTKKPEPFLLLHGDEMNSQRTSRIFINGVEPTTDLRWSRYGFNESVKLLTTVANSALMVHQRPYSIFEFESVGQGDININTVLLVDLMDGKYTFMSGYFDLMGGLHRLRFVESISDKLDANDIYGYEVFYEDYGDVKGKDGVSVSSPGGVGSGMGGVVIPGTLDPNGFIKNQQDYQPDAEFYVKKGKFLEDVYAPDFYGRLRGTADNSTLWNGYNNYFEVGVVGGVVNGIMASDGGSAYLFNASSIRTYLNETLETVLSKGNTSTLGAHFGSGVSWGVDGFEPGVSKIFNHPSYGTTISTKSGISSDFMILNSALSSAVFLNPASTRNIEFWGDIYTSNYVSGATGAGYKIDHNGNAEFDSVTIRKSLSVVELNIREITGTGGSFAVTNTFLVSEAIEGTEVWTLKFDNESGTIQNQLRVGDIIRCQVWDGSGLKYYTGVVNGANNEVIQIPKLSMTGTGVPAKGDHLFQFGNALDSDRQGLIYMTNSDTGAPYLDILDGVNSADLSGKTKVRLGKLDGIVSPIWGALSGYGLYGQNAYLENAYFSGSVNITGGNAATNQSVTDKINNIQVGGTNLLLNSGVQVTNNNYLTHKYTQSEPMVVGEEYTLTIWGDLGADKTFWNPHVDDGNTSIGFPVLVSEGVWILNFVAPTNNVDFISIYAGRPEERLPATIYKIKLEKGNKGTDWSPAPEDTIEYVDISKSVTNIDGGKIFNNPFSISGEGTVSARLVIDTGVPLGVYGNFMTSIRVRGYNYYEGKNDIDLTIGYYSFLIGNPFYNYGYTSNGSMQIGAVYLAINSLTNTVVLIIGEPGIEWKYPQIFVESASFSTHIPPDSFKDNWSGQFTEDFSTLTNITSCPAFVSESTEGSAYKSNAAEEAAKTYAANRVDTLQGSLGSLAWDSVVEAAKLGTTVIQGGYILTSLLRADEIQAAVVTSVYINTLALDASTIQTGKLSADRIDVDNLIAKNLKTFDTGRRLEITGGSNSLIFYGKSEIDDSIYNALEISDYIDSGNVNGYAVGGLRTNTSDGYTSYITGNGIYSNGGGVRFLDAAALNTNASIAATLTHRNSSVNGVSAAVAGVDLTSGSTLGSSTTYAGYFMGRTMLGGAIQTMNSSGGVKGGATGTFRWFAYVGANQVVWEYEFVNGLLTGARVV